MTGTEIPIEDPIELDRQHFVKTLAAFRFYSDYLSERIERSKAYYRSLPASYRRLICEFDQNLRKLEKCIFHNSVVISTIIQYSNHVNFNGKQDSGMLDADDGGTMCANFVKSPNQKIPPVEKFGSFAFTNTDMDKVRSAIKQFVRDWSLVGKPERDICYQPVIDEILQIFDPHLINPSKVKILVPGSGLGRLPWELAHRGYTCEGNEWSMYMLIPAYFVLNTCKKVSEYKIYPWISQFCNNVTREDQLASIEFPDVFPSDLPPDVQFSMAAGNFVEIYTDPDSWDCVATVFFIDTGHNILSYLNTIWLILKPGGYWINLGPLLYHFSDIPGEKSLELSYDELRLAIQRLGFETVKEKTGIQSGYTQNPKSMLAYHYSCVYGVYRKPIAKTSQL